MSHLYSENIMCELIQGDVTVMLEVMEATVERVEMVAMGLLELMVVRSGLVN